MPALVPEQRELEAAQQAAQEPQVAGPDPSRSAPEQVLQTTAQQQPEPPKLTTSEECSPLDERW